MLKACEVWSNAQIHRNLAQRGEVRSPCEALRCCKCQDRCSEFEQSRSTWPARAQSTKSMLQGSTHCLQGQLPVSSGCAGVCVGCQKEPEIVLPVADELAAVQLTVIARARWASPSQELHGINSVAEPCPRGAAEGRSLGSVVAERVKDPNAAWRKVQGEAPVLVRQGDGHTWAVLVQQRRG